MGMQWLGSFSWCLRFAVRIQLSRLVMILRNWMLMVMMSVRRMLTVATE
jgi:hypothetical protein